MTDKKEKINEEAPVNEEVKEKDAVVEEPKAEEDKPAEEEEKTEDSSQKTEDVKESTSAEATADKEETPEAEEPASSDQEPETAKTEDISQKSEEVKDETPVVEEKKEEPKAGEIVAEPVASDEKPEAEEVKSEEPAEEKPKAKKKPAVKKAGAPKDAEDDFDWSAVGKKADAYTEKERADLEEIYNKTMSSIVEHEVIDGTVVAKNNREVVVNIGFKSDGVIALNEFRYNPDLKIGDTIEVYVENQEDPSGQLLLSHKKARILKSWDRINAAFDNDEIINGYVKCRTKGGLIVDVFGIEAFLPGSQIDVKPIRDYDVFVDKTMEFKVVKINHEYKNVVVSHKALIEAELEQQKAEIMSKLEKGQVLEGTVKNITSYGVCIDLGGVNVLLSD